MNKTEAIIRIFSPAKINYSLRLGEKRKDQYHSISSLMILLKDLGDELEFSSLPETSHQKIVVHSLLGDKLKRRSSHFQLPTEKQNLVWKAADLFYRTLKLEPHIHIRLCKNVPLSAGLGGGSSNAAYTLTTLNSIHHRPLSQKQLSQLAATLGSDIPFFLTKKPAFVFGRGEKIKAAPFSPKGWFLIINPAFQISTKQAYQWWDERSHASLTKKRRDVTNDRFLLTTRKRMTVKQRCNNDFREVIYPRYPFLKEAEQKLLKAGARVASLSGSGPTLFGLFKTKTSAHKAATYFHEHNWLVWITRGV